MRGHCTLDRSEHKQSFLLSRACQRLTITSQASWFWRKGYIWFTSDSRERNSNQQKKTFQMIQMTVVIYKRPLLVLNYCFRQLRTRGQFQEAGVQREKLITSQRRSLTSAQDLKGALFFSLKLLLGNSHKFQKAACLASIY